MEPLTVRVLYVIPHDAMPWEDAKRRATDVLEDLQWFFADEMNRLSHGSQTFRIAYDQKSDVVFRQILSPRLTEDFLREDPGHNPPYINLCKEATIQELRNANDVVIYFFEAYAIERNRVMAGTRAMQRRGGGEAFLSSLHLKLASREWLKHSEGYAGLRFPWIMSTPMWEGALSWEGRGDKMGDAGAAYGVIAHEFIHCFGTSNHNKDLDSENRNENIMGTGFRRMREYFRPEPLKPRCILSRRAADILAGSKFFALRDLKPKGDHFLNRK